MLDQLDDAIRSVLADIAATAPTPDDLHPQPMAERGRERAQWLLAAVAVAAIGVVAGLIVLGDRTTPMSRMPTASSFTTSATATTGLVLDGRFPMVAARVTSPTAGATVVRIDHGSSDGIEAGMPVVSAAGLVGMIISVDDTTSELRLITDANYAIECVVDGASAACRGDGDSVDLVPLSGEPVPAGGTGVARSAGGPNSLAPPDIVIGRVTGASADGFSVLEPAADLDHLNLVDVVRYVPVRQLPDTPPTVAVAEPS